MAQWDKRARDEGAPSAPQRRPAAAPFGLRPDVAPSSTSRFGSAQAKAFVAVLVVVALALLVLPQVLRLARASHPTLVGDLSGQGSGAYLSTAGGYYKLRSSPQLPSFPRTSATVAPTVTVVARARGPVRPDRYRIVAYNSRAAVAVSVRRLGSSTVELRPAHTLAPGRYFVQMPADTASDDQSFFYFQVGVTASGSPTPTPSSSETATPSPASSDTATPTPAASESPTPSATSSDSGSPAPAP